MSTGSLRAREYRGERSSGVYYSVSFFAILFGLFWMGHGCLGFFGPEVHTAYFTTPACDESLLRAGKENLAPTCSIVAGKIWRTRPDKDEVGFDTYPPKGSADQKRIDAYDVNLTSSFDVKMSWDEAKKDQPVFIQIYNEMGPDHKQVYVASKVFDPATKEVRETSDLPISKNGQAWKDIKIAALIILGGLLWIALGSVMSFSD